MKRLIVAKSAGFCFGVKRAVDTVYEQAKKEKEPIYTYGPIIHNEAVVEDLEKRGVIVSIRLRNCARQKREPSSYVPMVWKKQFTRRSKNSVIRSWMPPVLLY